MKKISFCLEVMEKIDLKDRKILYELDLDSRQSFRSLAKKVDLSKDAVINRVKNLQDQGIIKGFYTVIYYPKIGFNIYRFYFSFQNVTPVLKKDIIEFFLNDKNVGAVSSLEGNYDLIVAIYVKNYPQAYAFWKNTLKNYGKYFSKKVFTAYCQENCYIKRFLLDESEKRPIIISQWFNTEKIIELGDTDHQIIKLVTQNARIPSLEIARKLDISTKTVQNRLRKLKKLKIINASRIHIDFAKLGYYIFKVDINLNEYDYLNNIIKYFESNIHLIEIIKTIGYVDIEVVLILKSAHQLHQIMENLSKKFPNAIKSHTYFSVINTYKTYGSFLDLKIK